MIAVATNEFKKLFFSIKSLIIILFFTWVSYSGVNFINNNFNGIIINTTYYSLLKVLVLFLGYIVVSILSHDAINTELKYETIRLVISKISRAEFLIGKLIGIFVFWILCISISFIIISIFSRTFNFFVIAYLISVIYYYISINLFISTIILNNTYSNFLGLIIGIVLPVLGLWLTLNEKWYSFFSYLLPYTQGYKIDLKVICSLIFAIILNYITYIILRGKDL